MSPSFKRRKEGEKKKGGVTSTVDEANTKEKDHLVAPFNKKSVALKGTKV